MGANFVTRIYAGNQSSIRHQFEKDQEEDRYENGHSYSGGLGMAKGLTFTDHETYTEAEAEEWLQDHVVKWDNALAVHLRNTDKWFVGALCSC